jgi:hypothetical protein
VAALPLVCRSVQKVAGTVSTHLVTCTRQSGCTFRLCALAVRHASVCIHTPTVRYLHTSSLFTK